MRICVCVYIDVRISSNIGSMCISCINNKKYVYHGAEYAENTFPHYAVKHNKYW